MLAGALTSKPSLAGAQDAYASGLGNLRDTTLRIEQAIQNVNVGYALTYLGGTAGVILFVTHFPRLMGIDIKKEANRLAKERGLLGKPKSGSRSKDAFPIIRAYRILPETAGKTLRQRAAESGNSGSALKIRRGGRSVRHGRAFDDRLRSGHHLCIRAGWLFFRHAGIETEPAAFSVPGAQTYFPQFGDCFSAW
jgi:uncharacterized transporter YbjL